MVTLKEIAELCNVSVATVSNVLNGKSKASAETAEQILKVVEETGYRPNYMAKGLRMQKSRSIALIVDDILQFTSAPMVESIMAYCENEDYRVTMRNLRLYNRWTDSWQYQKEAFNKILQPVIQDLLALHVDGIIYVAGHTRVVSCFDKNFPIPAVMAYAYSDAPQIPSIVIDDAVSAAEIVSYLISLGHKRIGFIGGRTDNYHTEQRLLGYQKALFENKILFDPDLVYCGEWERNTGYEGAKALIGNDVTAFFCTADKIAGGVYDYLEEAGIKVGTEISVTGFDDEDIASYLSPKLTTTKLPLAEIGHLSAKILLDRIENNKINYPEFEVHRIPCSFKQRNSVGVMNEENKGSNKDK